MIAYAYALNLARKGVVPMCFPGTNADGEPTVMVLGLEPQGWGLIAACHPHKRSRAAFLVGVAIGLHRACAQDPDFIPTAPECLN